MNPAKFLAILEMAAAASILSVGLAALRRNARNQIHQVFFVVALLLFLEHAAGGVNRLLIAAEVYVSDILLRLADCFLLWAALFLINFGTIFPGRGTHTETHSGAENRRRQSSALLYVLTAVVVVLSFLNFTSYLMRPGGYNPVTGSFSGSIGPLYIVNRALFLGALLIVIWEQRRFLRFHERDPRRIHSRYLIYGILAASAAAILLYALVELYGLLSFLAAGIALITASWAFFVHKILTYRSIGMRGSLFRNAAILLGMGLLVTPVVLLVQLVIARMYEGSALLLGITLGLFFIAFQQLAARLAPRLQRLVNQRARLEEVLSRYNSSILDLRSGEQSDVRDRLAEFLGELYRPRFLAFYGHDDGTVRVLTQIRPLTRIADVESIPPSTLPESLVSLLSRRDSETHDGGLVVDLLADADRALDLDSSRALAQLASFGAEIILPIYGLQFGTEMPTFEAEQDENRARVGAEPEAINAEGTSGPPASNASPPEVPGLLLLVGLARGGRPFDHTDLNLLRALRAPTTLAMNNQELLLSTRRLQEKLEEENRRIARRLSEQLPGADRTAPAAAFVYDPAGPMAAVIAQMERFAPRDSPVLITGETGTGKEQLARMLHAESGRDGELVAVNCSAIPPDLIENELFGHVRGGFTGADADTEGLVARAEGGTLFLDEIGEMPLQGQVKLLRLVQEGRYERIGSGEPLATTARFVFATNRHLQEEVQAGRFREDLYYRISTFEVRLPSLRERRSDLPLLVRHFLTRAADQLKRGRITITPAAEELLLKYPFPGNVRELENLIQRSIVLSDSSVLDVENLPIMFRDRIDFSRKQRQLERITLEQGRLEKELLLEALERTGGNQRKAAEILKISRGSLQYRLKQYGLVSDS